MDQLPDIQSDADVDALMARIRAKLAPPASSSQAPDSLAPPSGNALRDFLTVQEEHASTMVHALRVIADVFEDLQAEAEAVRKPRRPSRVRTTHVNGRRRKTR